METTNQVYGQHQPVFGADWFSPVIPVWEEFLGRYRGQPEVRMLEVGSYEGRSALWLMENILTHETARLDCIDVFKEDGLKEAGSSFDILERFRHNLAPYAAKVAWHQGRSQAVLRRGEFSPETCKKYDVIYIDGSHEARDVLEDAVLAYRLLKVGGLLIFDDFEYVGWVEGFRNPKTAILSFFGVYKQQFKLLHKSRQFVLERIRE
ncbi:MAG TPA: class I SAM-dependent methyltransferase [Pyrinomonadaceae bacterium]|jgi:predicted O-methyltransferase YrrM